MNLSQLCWLSTAAMGLHILEEYALDWRGWVKAATGVEVEWGLFYGANSLAIVLGVVCAELAPTLPTLALALPALMLINALFFHVGGFVRLRGRFSPGLLTAVLLFLPLGTACYRVAWRSGMVSAWSVVESLLLGAAIMMAPIALIKLRSLPYFQQRHENEVRRESR